MKWYSLAVFLVLISAVPLFAHRGWQGVGHPEVGHGFVPQHGREPFHGTPRAPEAPRAGYRDREGHPEALTYIKTANGLVTIPDAVTPGFTSIIPGSTAISKAVSALVSCGAWVAEVRAGSGSADFTLASLPLTLPI